MVKVLYAKYTNLYSHFVSINGLNVHYRDEGEGEVVLLLHGAFASLHTFDIWTDRLKKDYRVIRIDLPGFGLTGPIYNDEYSIEIYTDFLARFLDELEIKQCSIAGSSLGGWAAWEFALHYKTRVQKLILINSAGFISENPNPLPFVIAQTPVLRQVFNYVPKAVVRRFIRQVYHNQTLVTEELVDRYYELFHREGNQEAFVKIANSQFTDNTDKLGEIETETLVMWGEKDQWISLDNAHRFIAGIPNSMLVTYAEVGHLPMEEIPEQSFYDIFKFLKK